MNKTWISVFIAAIFEVLWAVGLKYADNVWAWVGTLICIIISFYLMIMSGRTLPVGTVYAVFVGIGTVGIVFLDIVFFGEPLKISTVILIGLLVTGVIGLKLVTKDQQNEGAES